jgi:uncharacterized protein YutE (UPF0331/DUF86 family)
LSVRELEENHLIKSAIERNFHLAIESALDIGEILISEENFEKPEDYKSVFLILGKNNVIPKDFAENFAPIAGFRNVLVHLYEDVDLKILQRYLSEKLVDLDIFAKHIAKYLENKEY